MGLGRGLLHHQHLGRAILEAGRRLTGLIAVHPLKKASANSFAAAIASILSSSFGRLDDVAALSRIGQAHKLEGAASRLEDRKPFADVADRNDPVLGFDGHGAKD